MSELENTVQLEKELQDIRDGLDRLQVRNSTFYDGNGEKQTLLDKLDRLIDAIAEEQ